MKKFSYIFLFVFILTAFAQAAKADTINLAGDFSFTKDLYPGLKGDDVKKLQILLNENIQTHVAAFGEIGSSGNESDYFGAATKKAVQTFQKINGIPQTGYVGVLTRKALNDALNNGGLSEVVSPLISNIFATRPNGTSSEIINVSFDGNGEAPTVWFAYGAKIDAMTLSSPEMKGSEIKSNASITLSDLSSEDYYVKAYVKNSYGTTTSSIIKFNGATGK